MVAFALSVLLGVALLAFAADQFVVGAVRLARLLRVSLVVVGVVVVGFGTSAPEILVSGLAAGQGDLDVAVGNVLGSNMANLLLVLGVAALLMAINITSRLVRREIPIAVAASALYVAVLTVGFPRWAALCLLLLGLSVVAFTAVTARGGDAVLAAEMGEIVEGGKLGRLPSEALRTFLGLVGTLLGAELLLWGAAGGARRLGVPETFIGFTLVALGTSLPELVTAIHSARRGEDELVIGNLLGSNVINSLIVGGVAGLAATGGYDRSFALVAGIAMLVITLAVAGVLVSVRGIPRWAGALFLATYAGIAVAMYN